MVFDRDGNYLDRWGIGAITDPHGINIVDDIVYITDRSDHVAVKFTLDGKPLQVIGDRGVHSDTGCEKPGDLCPRAAGPFNYCTEMSPSPSGDIYVSDGYRNARVHRFSSNGQLIQSWGQPGKTEPGHFHLVHSLLVDPEGKVYVCDRANRRVQIFSPDGEFITMWTGMGGPDNIVRDKDGIFYIAEQADESGDSHVSIWDGDGNVLERWPIRHAHGLWVDSHGDIYLGLTLEHSVDKYVRNG
jgi:DNA-binding beta-propeller fold protein YncE